RSEAGGRKTSGGRSMTYDGGPSEDHAVQFYDDDAVMVEAATAHLAAGLEAGDAIVAVATRAHLDAIADRLDGPALRDALQGGRAHLVDAAALLADVVVRGQPD